MAAEVGDSVQALVDHAIRLARAGRLEQAMAVAEQLPASPATFQLQISLLKGSHKPADRQRARDICAQWQQSSPHSAEPLFELIQLYWSAGQAELTLPLATRAAELEPNHRLTPYYQAVSQQLIGEVDNAISNHRLALLRNTKHPFSKLELELEVGIAAYDVAAGHYPGSPGLNEVALVDEQSICTFLQKHLQSWLDSGPDFSTLRPDQVTRYGNACYNLGCMEVNRYHGQNRALQYFRTALQVNPEHVLARANYLFVSNYVPALNGQAALDLHRATAAALRQQYGSPKTSWSGVPDPDRVLRIAYLSSDFRRHSVAHFIIPVLESHSQENVHISAWYTGHKHDEWTQRAKNAVQKFTPAGNVTDQQLYQQITQDRIDILVDLNGYTQGHRMGVLARRAAPIQINWIGYPGTTGLDVMDYRIVDSITDPQPQATGHSSEQLIYLDPVFSVYLPASPLPDIAPQTPATSNGCFTFGSFNALPKLNPELLQLWGRILARVKNSKLLVKNRMLDQISVREEVSSALAEAGIAADRQILLGRTKSQYDHMQTYRSVDLCLDSYPYNGTTTTCDALVMGVPVVTLAGTRHVNRVTASQLNCVGLNDLIANNGTEYVDIAVNLALNTAKLNDIHKGLRQRMQRSALMDYRGLTQQLEKKYRKIWQIWCAQTTALGRP